jgi:hypothetical protein
MLSLAQLASVAEDFLSCLASWGVFVIFWPLFGMRQFGEIAPIHQMQFVQTAVDALCIRYLCGRALSDAEMLAVAQRVNAHVGYPMRISFERSLTPLNAGAGYKFEEFKSLVDVPQSGSIFKG